MTSPSLALLIIFMGKQLHPYGQTVLGEWEVIRFNLRKRTVAYSLGSTAPSMASKHQLAGRSKFATYHVLMTQHNDIAIHTV